jgi:hypothetical protein
VTIDHWRNEEGIPESHEGGRVQDLDLDLDPDQGVRKRRVVRLN